MSDFQPRLNSKSVSHAHDLFPRIRHFQREICYVYVMYVSDEEELQLIFLEDSGTLEYSTCILLQSLCVQCSLKIYCVHVYGVLVRRV